MNAANSSAANAIDFYLESFGPNELSAAVTSSTRGRECAGRRRPAGERPCMRAKASARECWIRWNAAVIGASRSAAS